MGHGKAPRAPFAHDGITLERFRPRGEKVARRRRHAEVEHVIDRVRAKPGDDAIVKGRALAGRAVGEEEAVRHRLRQLLDVCQRRYQKNPSPARDPIM